MSDYASSRGSDGGLPVHISLSVKDFGKFTEGMEEIDDLINILLGYMQVPFKSNDAQDKHGNNTEYDIQSNYILSQIGTTKEKLELVLRECARLADLNENIPNLKSDTEENKSDPGTIEIEDDTDTEDIKSVPRATDIKSKPNIESVTLNMDDLDKLIRQRMLPFEQKLHLQEKNYTNLQGFGFMCLLEDDLYKQREKAKQSNTVVKEIYEWTRLLNRKVQKASHICNKLVFQ